MATLLETFSDKTYQTASEFCTFMEYYALADRCCGAEVHHTYVMNVNCCLATVVQEAGSHLVRNLLNLLWGDQKARFQA